MSLPEAYRSPRVYENLFIEAAAKLTAYFFQGSGDTKKKPYHTWHGDYSDFPKVKTSHCQMTGKRHWKV